MISISLKGFNLKTFVVLLFICVIKVSSDHFGESDVDIDEHNPVLEERQLFADNQQMIVWKKSRIIKSKEEMEKTKESPVIDPQPCNDFHPIAVFIHSAAEISDKYFWRRVLSRETWVKDMKRLNISVYFAIALNTDSNINEEIKKESDINKDIIQFSFIDSYRNLTLKAVSILRWIERKCKTAKYIIKTDDDILVDTTKLVNNLDGMNGIVGKPYDNLRAVIRNKTNKWYMPHKYYNKTYYPRYTPGPLYVMAENVSSRLLKTIDEYRDPILFIDDAFITGIIAEKAGIERIRTNLMSRYFCNMTYVGLGCHFCDSSIRFHCIDHNLRVEIWDAFKSSNESRQTVKIVGQIHQSIPSTIPMSNTSEPFTCSTLCLVSTTNSCEYESNFWFWFSMIVIGLVGIVAIGLAVVTLIADFIRKANSNENPGLHSHQHDSGL